VSKEMVGDQECRKKKVWIPVVFDTVEASGFGGCGVFVGGRLFRFGWGGARWWFGFFGGGEGGETRLVVNLVRERRGGPTPEGGCPNRVRL